MSTGKAGPGANGLMASVLAFMMVFLMLFVGPSLSSAAVYLKVGILSDPKNLNPFYPGDAWAKRVTMLIYQPLYILEPDTMSLVPWLAEDQPVYDAERKTVTFRLRAMQWDDGSEFSADDVVFTSEAFRRFHMPRFYPQWKFVRRIEALDKRTVRLTLEQPAPTLYTRALTTWVVQRKVWEPVMRMAEARLIQAHGNMDDLEAEEAEAASSQIWKEAVELIQSHRVTRPVGLGPFKLKEWREGEHILLVRNEHFFGRGKDVGGRQLGPFADGVLFRVYPSQMAAAAALKQGGIDFLWKGVSHALVKDLSQDPKIRLLHALDDGYRYLGFNLRKAPMSDIAFRRAVAYLTDKDHIVERILHGHGERLDTLVPTGNPFFFNPHTESYGKGMDPKTRNREAYRILSEAGYTWQKPPFNPHGEPQQAEGLILPNGKPVEPLTLITPTVDYDVEMASAGQVINEWLKNLGVPVSWKPMVFKGVAHAVRMEGTFDMFISGWRNLHVDPDYLRRFFGSTGGRANEWNFTGYRNPDFDRLAELQSRTVDPQARKDIVWELQGRLMKDLPYVPLYVPARLDGVRTDRFEGWVESRGGVGNRWTFSTLRPVKK